MKEFHEGGITIILRKYPFEPLFNDNREITNESISKTSECGALYIIFSISNKNLDIGINMKKI